MRIQMKFKICSILAALFFLSLSTQAQVTWDPPQKLTWNVSFIYDAPPCVGTYWKFVHVVWEDWKTGEGEYYYLRSSDYGASWSKIKRLTWDGNHIGLIATAASRSNVHMIHDEDGSYLVYRRSTDHGKTWVKKRFPYERRFNMRRILSVSRAAVGDNLHVVVVAEPFGITGVWYYGSRDNGESWDYEYLIEYSIYINHASIAASNHSLHVVYSNWGDHLGHYDLFHAVSFDNGNSWEIRNQIAGIKEPNPGISYDSPGHTPIADIAAAGPGVHIVYPDDREDRDVYEIYSTNSTDHGISWDTPKQITYRSDSIVYSKGLAADGQDLYMVYEKWSSGDLFFKTSSNGGDTWSNPFRIAWADGLFFMFSNPAIAVNPASGYIHIVYPYYGYLYYKRGQQ
jgi:hypothetical protein